jgi:hypothetical protein
MEVELPANVMVSLVGLRDVIEVRSFPREAIGRRFEENGVVGWVMGLDPWLIFGVFILPIQILVMVLIYFFCIKTARFAKKLPQTFFRLVETMYIYFCLKAKLYSLS